MCGQAQQLLQGLAGTYIRIRYRRPPNAFDMNCTLLRETGTEHTLTEQHGGWKTIDLTDNRLQLPLVCLQSVDQDTETSECA